MGLIDADKLKKDLESVTLSNGTLLNTNTVLALLDKYPTAYDVDKLLQQLEENFKPDIECFEYAEDYEYSLERYNRMIEIVKRGGKEQ